MTETRRFTYPSRAAEAILQNKIDSIIRITLQRINDQIFVHNDYIVIIFVKTDQDHNDDCQCHEFH